VPELILPEGWSREIETLIANARAVDELPLKRTTRKSFESVALQRFQNFFLVWV